MIWFQKSIFSALIAALTIQGFSIFTKPVNAGLFLSPIYLKLESEQGQSKGVLQVGNTGAKPIRVRLYATAFTYDQNGMFQRHNSNLKKNQSVNPASGYDLTPYLRYSPQEIVIPGNSSRRVRLISLLPPSLPEGEYRTAIFAETLQEKTGQGFTVGLNMSIGSALYVAKGEIKPEISIVDSSFDTNEHKIKILINNSGNATAKGNINWILKQGKNIITSGESGGSFLPNSQTNIILNRNAIKNSNSPLNLNPGNYQLEGEITWDEADQKKRSNFNFDLEV